MRLLLRIILSAILFNLGLLSLVSLIILYPVFLHKIDLKKSSLLGLVWGVIVYGLHFVWLLILLIYRSHTGLFCSYLVYLFIVFYLGLLSSAWFVASCFFMKFFKKSLLKIASFVVVMFLYFVFINNYSVWFAGSVEGYPFIDLGIPKFVGQANELCKRKRNSKFFKIFYLPPIDLNKKNVTPGIVGQYIYHELAKLNLEKYKNKYEKLIVVSPETSYPYPLNKNLDVLKFWENLLPNNAYFMLGSQRQEGVKFYQTVYFIQGRRIIYFYDKKHCVKFVEKVPKNYKNFALARGSFLTENLEFSKSKFKKFSAFELSDKLRVIPIICSEFFYLNLSGLKKIKEQAKPGQETFLFLFVNDSWFSPYFKNIISDNVRYRSFLLDMPVVFIGHSGFWEV